MDKSVENFPGKRFADVIGRLDLSRTEVSLRLGADYTALSAFHNGRRQSIGRNISAASYVRVLEEMTGKSAEVLGLADLLIESEGAAA